MRHRMPTLGVRRLALSIGAFVLAAGECGVPRSDGIAVAENPTTPVQHVTAVDGATPTDALSAPEIDSNVSADDTSPATASGTLDSLRIEIVAPAEIQVGSEIPITLRLTNTSGRPMRLYLMGREMTFDLMVTGPDGSVVWRRLEGQTIPAILRIELIEPAGVLALKDAWDQRTNAGDPVEPGSYSIQGVIPTDAEPLITEPVPVQILPR